MTMRLKQQYRASLARILDQHRDKFDITREGTDSLAGWFLGPKAENQELFHRLLTRALEAHCSTRREYFPEDPGFITEEIKDSPEYRDTVRFLEEELDKILHELRGSVPFWSNRWQSHMNWDLTMPSLLGYFATTLYNPNNVAAEASPVTTMLEMEVGDDLCRMLGYTIPPPDDEDAVRPWGHITCDGSVANLEALWASRNLKLYPVTIARAIEHQEVLAPARSMTVPLPTGGDGVLIELDGWQILNLSTDVILDLAPRLTSEYGIDATVVSDATAPYSVQNVGLVEFYRRFLEDAQPMVSFGPSTMHYSWPKGAAIVGVGKDSMEPIHVDLFARMEVAHLREKLEDCLRRRRPVMMVVVVVGSTEESAVDPLDEIVALREEMSREGLTFELHVDGAWGGYFASILRKDPHAPEAELALHSRREYAPAMCMSPYVTRQYQALPYADSITIDPHKAGYCPYPAGGLCYRNGAMRDLVAFTAPVVYHGGTDPTVGVYGVEGSKPGAAPAGVYLSHRVIRPDQSGYGKILGKSFWSSKRLYAALITMADERDDFTVTPFQRIPAEVEGGSPGEIRAQYEYIRREIVPKTNDELLADRQAMELFRQLGSDQIILAYSFNFKDENGELNSDLDLANQLNNDIFTALSLQTYNGGHVPDVPMFVTSSDFEPAIYGQALVDDYSRRMGVDARPGESVQFLISTTMNPWLTDTERGDFIPTLIEVLRETVEASVRKVRGG